jgi:hypothetical protein
MLRIFLILRFNCFEPKTLSFSRSLVWPRWFAGATFIFNSPICNLVSHIYDLAT